MRQRTVPLAILALIFGLLVVPTVQGGSIDVIQPIYNGPELDYQPAIIRVQPSGRLLAVFERLQVGTYMGDFYVTYSDDGGQSWSTPTPALTSALNERHPSLVQLGPNSFALFYLLCDDHSGANARIHRATSNDGLTWTDHGMVDLGWATTGELNPTVARQNDGTLTMTYQRSGAGYIAQSSDDGVTWDTQRTLVNNSARLPRVAYRESDGLYIVSYQKSIGGYDMGIYAKASTDPYDWSSPEIPLSTNEDSHDSQAIVTEDGGLVLFYAKTLPGPYYDLYYRTSCSAADWTPEVRLTFDPTHYDTQPHPLLQGTPDHLMLAWPHQESVDPYVDHDLWLNDDLLLAGDPDLSPSSSAFAPPYFVPGDRLTVSLILANGAFGATAADLVNPIPEDTTYQPGSLWAEGGAYGYDPLSDAITWTGTLSTCSQVAVTWAVTTSAGLGDGETITNTTWLTDGQGTIYTWEAYAIADALPPTSTILYPQHGQYLSSTSTLIEGLAGDSASGVSLVEVRIDGAPCLPAQGTENWTFLWEGYDDGAHNIRAFATDLLGHIEPEGTGITVTVDTIPPTLLAHQPAAGQVDVPLSATIVLTFSEAIVSDTLAFSLTPDPGGWSAAWNGEATVASLDHANLMPGQSYTFTVNQARDRALNPLAPASWSFTTAPPPCEGVSGVDLSWTPLTPTAGQPVALTAGAQGTPPITFTWDLGDSGRSASQAGLRLTAAAAITEAITHTYAAAGAYTVTVSAANACGADAAARPLVVVPGSWAVYLPLVYK